MTFTTVTIIVPILNEEKVMHSLLEQLQTLLQSNTQIEVIIVDGGSSDNSLQQIEGAYFPLKMLSSKTAGRGLQMNLGASQANGQWLLFLHADTTLPAAAISTIEKLPVAIQAGCFTHQFSGGHWLLNIISKLHNWRFTRTGIIYGDETLFIRRDFFNQINGFPTTEILEDVYISEKILQYCTPIKLDLPIITNARKFLSKGVWKSLLQVLLIQLHCHIKIPLLAKSFFEPVR